MTRTPLPHLLLPLLPILLLLFHIQPAAAEANPVVIANPAAQAPEAQADGSAPKGKGGWWVVDKSGPGTGPQDAWWTGCLNRTSEEQRNTTLANTVTTQACLDWYYWGGLKDNWSGVICNNMGFFRGNADGYSDGAACYEKCYGCLSQSIQAGAINAICRDGHGQGVQGVMQGKSEVPDK
ncbi:hypothetical protein XANCAGTX0491_009611 [Xanthoria calcicola]